MKPDEKVTFVAEGGWINNDGEVQGLSDEQLEIHNGLKEYFGDNLEVQT